MTRLRSHRICPPGEFFIKVLLRGTTVTPVWGPCSNDDGCYTFGPSPDIKMVAKNYTDFLKGNNLSEARFNSSLEQIDAYTCTRLGGNSRWCYDSEADYAATTRIILSRGGKGCCGAKLT